MQTQTQTKATSSSLYRTVREEDVKAFETFHLDKNSVKVLKTAIQQLIELEDPTATLRFASVNWIQNNIQEFRCKVGLSPSATGPEIKEAQKIFKPHNVVQAEEHKPGVVHQQTCDLIRQDPEELKKAPKLGFLQFCGGASFTLKLKEEQPGEFVLYLGVTNRSAKNTSMFPIHPVGSAIFLFSDKNITFDEDQQYFIRMPNTLLYDLTRSQPKVFLDKSIRPLGRFLENIVSKLDINCRIKIVYKDCYSFEYEGMFKSIFEEKFEKNRSYALKELMLRTLYIAAGTRSRWLFNKGQPQYKTHSGYETEIHAVFKEAKDLGITLDLSAIPQDFDEQTTIPALGLAAKNGYVATVKIFLDHKADIHQADKNGFTALVHAVREDHLEVAQLLLGKNANLLHLSTDKSTLLHHANSPEMMSFLLEQKKISCNAVTRTGMTALHNAVSSRNMKVVECLIEQKADPDLPNKKGESPLYTAIKLRNREMVNYLLSSVKNPNQKTNAGISPLVLAAEQKDSTLLKCLLSDPRMDLNECRKILSSLTPTQGRYSPTHFQQNSVDDQEKQVLLSQYIEKHNTTKQKSNRLGDSD